MVPDKWHTKTRFPPRFHDATNEIHQKCESQITITASRRPNWNSNGIKISNKNKNSYDCDSYQNVNINALQSNSENLNSGISHLRGLKKFTVRFEKIHPF